MTNWTLVNRINTKQRQHSGRVACNCGNHSSTT